MNKEQVVIKHLWILYLFSILILDTFVGEEKTAASTAQSKSDLFKWNETC